jgi:hypothetical protein
MLLFKEENKSFKRLLLAGVFLFLLDKCFVVAQRQIVELLFCQIDLLLIISALRIYQYGIEFVIFKQSPYSLFSLPI